MNRVDEKTLVPLSILTVMAAAIGWATWLHSDITNAKQDIVGIVSKLEKIEEMNGQINLNTEDIKFLNSEVEALDGMNNRLIQIETKLDLIYQRMNKR